MELNSNISAVITGAASGLGAGTAKALAAKGVKVGILDVNEELGAKTAAEIGGTFARCDVTDEASVDTALAAVRAAHGQERILINCAGIAIGKRLVRKDRETGAISHHDIASYTRVININLIGTFTMIAKCAAGMVTLDPTGPDNERGMIISTASVAAEDGQIGQVAYAASKGGVQSMTLPVARDLAKDGIRVAAILPGLFHTPMFDGLPDEAKDALAASVPFPSRLGTPAEYAQLALSICENVMLNGVNIRLDGAVRLAPR
ncbi:MAG: NAD(P)-dependent dehydrogenase (short-subunit alcohol dehydrogenase family) [Hyphomicrobiaceae bacterium]|jgi:NAD(P)-dependent dehydrogenase (short-subunit alcohol dehydrogenase family)